MTGSGAAGERIEMTAGELNARYHEAIKGKSRVSMGDFHCKRCGVCCEGYFKKLSLNLDDLFNASAAVNLEPITFFHRYCQREPIDGKYTIAMDLSRGCPFHAKGSGCTIHERKPTACRSYPFLKMEIMYVGDQPYYQKIPGCAFGEMDRDALIRHDVETAVTSTMWDRATDCYLTNFKVTNEGLKRFHGSARCYVDDPVARAMVRDESIVTRMMLNTIFREKGMKLPADDIRAQRDEIVFFSFVEDAMETIPRRDDS